MRSCVKTSKKKTKKNFRQKVEEGLHGKRKYRLRKQLEKDGDKEIKDAT